MKDKKYPRYWRPLYRANLTSPEPEEVIELSMKEWNCSREEAKRRLDEEFSRCEYWVNDRYQVEKRQINERWVQLNIRHRDGTAIFRDWRHFQAIKNQLVGEECEAIELYPAESRLVDTSNKYHLWCCIDPTYRFFDVPPFNERDVNYDDKSKVPGIRQRSF